MKKNICIYHIKEFLHKYFDVMNRLINIRQRNLSLQKTEKSTLNTDVEINTMLSLPGTMSKTARPQLHGDLAKSSQTDLAPDNVKYHIQDGL